MSLNSFSNLTSWELITCFKSMMILACYKFFTKPRLILINYSSSMIVQLVMHRFWTRSWTSVLSIAISPISGWKKVFGRCCLKVSWGMAIWIGSTNTSLTCLSNKVGSTNISSIGTYTCSTKFKLVDGIKLIGFSSLIGVGTTMIPKK